MILMVLVIRMVIIIIILIIIMIIIVIIMIFDFRVLNHHVILTLTAIYKKKRLIMNMHGTHVSM